MEQVRVWNKMFIVELGPGIPYPKQAERWPRYGEPLSRLFDPYFRHVVFQWFKDDSGNFLAGVNAACFESTSKWKESQDGQRDFELFASLFAPINDFFAKLGSWADITGLLNIDESFRNFVVETAEAKLSGTILSAFSGQLPVESDEPACKKGGHLIKHNERYYVAYIGKHTGFKRFRVLSKEQAMEITQADANHPWQRL